MKTVAPAKPARPCRQWHSLRFQLLSRSLLILAILLILIGILQYAFMRETIYRNRAVSLHSQVLSIAPAQWEALLNDGEETRGQQPRPPFILMPGTSLAFSDREGQYRILIGDPTKSPPELTEVQKSQLLDRRSRQPYLVYGSGADEQLVVAVPIGGEAGQMMGSAYICSPTQPLRDLLGRHMLIFLALALAAMTIGLLAFRPVLRRTLVPLSNMVETAAQIDAGHLDRRFPTGQGQAEIDQLSESFNGMLHRLETTFTAEKETQEQMRRFIADASHELRTPLTSIHGFLEILLRGAADQPEQLQEALHSMHGESQRLNKLVHDLLLLSKLDRKPRAEMEVGFLDTTVQAMEPQLRILAGERRLVLTIQPDLECRYNPDQIKQVILNLFQNAVQHTDPDDGQIRVSLLKQYEHIQLVIEDNGQGISPEHIDHIFERFYRSDTSRTRREGGAGLGLAITKAIVESHGGTINVSSHVGEGTSVRVRLPEAGLELK
ncbi:MAG: ATP-binding protein [Syntrophomonas sp.]|nr:ATP-binding protein [Syntrophomonas sp.]